MKYVAGILWATILALLCIVLWATPARAQVISPARGGTGSVSAPTYGQVLVGQSNGTYAPQATSTLGVGGITSVSSSGGTTGLTLTTTNPTSVPSLTLSGILNASNGGTGTGSTPSYGQVLVGTSGNTYTLAATSSLGFENLFTNRVITVCASTVTSTSGCNYVADGTDDQVQIQAAYEQAGAIGGQGGVVQLSPGTFSVSATTTLDKGSVAIQGSGLDATIVKVASGANTSAFAYTGSSNIIFDSLRDFTIDGNRDFNTWGYGIYIKPSGSATFWDFTVRDVWTKEFSSDGLYMYDDHGLTLDHFLSEFNDGNGETILGSGTDAGRQTGGTFLFNGGNGVSIGATGFVFQGNVVGQNDGHGAAITGDDVVATGNFFSGDSYTTHTTADEINVTGSGGNISNNTINGEFSSRYGVNVSGSSTGAIVSDNQIVQTNSGNINDAGTGTQRSNNGDGIVSFYGPSGVGAKLKLYNGSGLAAVQLFGNTISNLAGNLYLNYFGVGPTEVGSADNPSVASTSQDLFVSGALEAKNLAYFDNGFTVTGNSTFTKLITLSNVIQLNPGVGASSGIAMGADSAKWGYTSGFTTNYTYFGLGSNKNQLVVETNGNIANDAKHAAQSNPTLFIQSSTSPATDANQWVSLTDAGSLGGILTTGEGPIILSASSSKVGIGTTSPATALDVSGLFRALQTSTTTCSASIEGSSFYSSGNKHFWGCDGTNWNRLDN
jgi:hypothetical protein